MLPYCIIFSVAAVLILGYFIYSFIRMSKKKKKVVIHTPKFIFFAAIVFFLIGTAGGFFAIFNKNWLGIIGAVAILLISIAAMLLQINQRVVMVSESKFASYSLFGKKSVFLLSEVKKIRKNPDSYTIFVGDGKIHVDSIARMEPEFAEMLKNAIKENKNIS